MYHYCYLFSRHRNTTCLLPLPLIAVPYALLKPLIWIGSPHGFKKIHRVSYTATLNCFLSRPTTVALRWRSLNTALWFFGATSPVKTCTAYKLGSIFLLKRASLPPKWSSFTYTSALKPTYTATPSHSLPKIWRPKSQ